MRHGTGAHFACLDFLFEIFHRNILPEISVKVDDDGLDAAHGIENGGEVVVVADLRGELFAFDAEFVFQEVVGKGDPVTFGICHVMSVEVAGGSAELSGERNVFQESDLLFETIDIDLDLLSESCGGSRLPVCSCQHGDIFPFLRSVFECPDEFFQLRKIDLFGGFFEHEGEGCVVDVL